MADFDFGIGGFGGPTDIGDLGGYTPMQPPPTSMGDTGLNLGTGGSWLDNLSGYASQALPWLRLGTQGLGAFAGIEGMIQSGQQNRFMRNAQQTAQSAAAPALASEQQLIPAGTAAMLGGPLPPALEAQVHQWSTDAKAKARAYYAHAGIQDSSMMAQVDAYIDQLALGMRAQYAQGLLQGGLGAGAGAVSAAGLGGSLAGQQGNATNQAIQQANQALYRLLGMG